MNPESWCNSHFYPFNDTSYSTQHVPTALRKRLDHSHTNTCKRAPVTFGTSGTASFAHSEGQHKGVDSGICWEKYTSLRSGRIECTQLQRGKRPQSFLNKEQCLRSITSEHHLSHRHVVYIILVSYWWPYSLKYPSLWECKHVKFTGNPPVWQAPPSHPSGQLQIPGDTQTPPFLQPWGQIAEKGGINHRNIFLVRQEKQ